MRLLAWLIPAEANHVFKAEVDYETQQVVLSLNLNKASYMDFLADVMDPEVRAQLKEEVKSLLYHIASAGLNAAINEISVNGNTVLQIENYELDALMDVLHDVFDGDVSGLINMAGSALSGAMVAFFGVPLIVILNGLSNL